MSEQQQLNVSVTEPAPDRRLAWVATLLAMVLATISVIALLIVNVGRERDKDENRAKIEQLSEELRNAKATLTCRDELEASVTLADQVAMTAHIELIIELAVQFNVVLSDQVPDRAQLQEQIDMTRAAVEHAHETAVEARAEMENCD